MLRSARTLACFGFLFALAGCGGGGAAPVPDADSKPTLTDADKALIEKQKLCLVAEEPLGSMGTPIKLTVKGRDVFLCCESCREAVLADPDKYLAKLDANGAVIVVPEVKSPAGGEAGASPN